ncbi:MAG: holo-ACP synthase [Anaerolineae bacterium]|nr:holo-ACP synthase [Anaerolineae bacterium]MCI0609318.1 holo-ACP synthase [Anaerolineae bacterium]
MPNIENKMTVTPALACRCKCDELYFIIFGGVQMIRGIGIDITEIEKIAKSIERDSFQRKVFTPAELEACLEIKNSVECLAGKFAVKEAFMKALGAGIRQEVWFTQIEVLNDESGKPYVIVSGEAEKRLQASGANQIHISISHSGGMAVAVVILEE